MEHCPSRSRVSVMHLVGLAGLCSAVCVCAWRQSSAEVGGKGNGTEAKVKGSAQYRVISRGSAAGSYQAFPDVCRAANGDIIVVFYAGTGHGTPPSPQWPKGGRICTVRSGDEGRTWTEPEVLYDDDHDNRDPHIAQLSDGTLVCSLFSVWTEGGTPKGSGAQLVRSHDGGKTWDKTAQAACPTYWCSAPVRELPDGTLVLGVYYEGNGRAWGGVIRSTDKGQTWSAPIPIGKGAGLYLDAETDVIRLKDGRLYAALRGGGGANMHYATSGDEGLTWTAVKDIGFKGHCPHLNRRTTGEILLGVRRLPPPSFDTSLYVSRDECATWQGPYQLDTVGGAYPSTVESKDGSVLAVYYEEGEGSAVRARRFRLTAKGVVFLPL
jgi:sialidase-1